MNNNNIENKANIIDKVDNRTEKRMVGDQGEELACKFLMKQGYKIKDRNYLRKYGEIDIIAEKQGIYHFVEVKTVTREINSNVIYETNDQYRPEDNVHPWKLKRLGRVIEAYILEKHLFNDEWKFDVITVYINNLTGQVGIDFLEDLVL